MRPYVGITGAVTEEEVKDICREFREAGYTLDSYYIPMLGFLVSQKTLSGLPTENRRYPPVNRLESLLGRTNGEVFTMVHYNSREQETLADQVAMLFNGIYDKNLCRALQLNVVWPDMGEVKKIKRRFPSMSIVLQVSSSAMKGLTPKDIALRVDKYGDSISYVLIDPSGGKGRPFNLKKSCAIYDAVILYVPLGEYLCIGFAGGLTGSSVKSVVRALNEELRNAPFCIDAEGGLRDKVTDAYGDDTLNIEKVRAYVRAVSTVLR